METARFSLCLLLDTAWGIARRNIASYTESALQARVLSRQSGRSVHRINHVNGYFRTRQPDLKEFEGLNGLFMSW